MLRCALLLTFAGTVGALGSTQGLMRAREVSVARQELRQQLQRLLPQQQQDLGLLVPALKAADRTGFRAHLTRMVHNGGNARIKKCLEGLSVVGFDATEIQAWLQSASAPVPQSNILKTRAEKAQLEAHKKLQVQLAAEQKKDKIVAQKATAVKHEPVQKQIQVHKEVKEVDKSTAGTKKDRALAVLHDIERKVPREKPQHAQAEKHVSVQKPNQEFKQVKAVDNSKAETKKDRALAVLHDIERKVPQENPQHVEIQERPELSGGIVKRVAAGEQTREQKKIIDLNKLDMSKETKGHTPIGTHGSLRKRIDAKSKSIPAVSAMAGSTVEQQRAASAQGQVHEDLTKADSEKQKADKEKKKAALRRELSKRLTKGVQALSRVQSLEKEEADLKSTISASEARVRKFEEALAEEVEAREKIERENKDLKAEVLQEEKKSKAVDARLDAIEKHELDAPKDTAARLDVLEEENRKFRSALAGAAKRIINIESQVARKQAGKANNEHPAEPVS